MRTQTGRFFILLLFVLSSTATAVERPPNVVFVLIDDLGWSDLPAYGNGFVDTPNVDRLAREGMKFTDFYAAGAVCSPTRASIQSGQNQARFGLTDFISGHWRPFEKVVTPQTALRMPRPIHTIAETMRDIGYRTGYFGKWHLGGGKTSPRGQGYDESISTGRLEHFAPNFSIQPKNAPEPKPQQYLSEYLTDHALDFIRRHRDRPFFALISHLAVHIPLEARRELIEKYEERKKTRETLLHPVYAAMIEHCDRSLGRILVELDTLKLSDNTIVIFTSDNGGLHSHFGGGGTVVTSNAPLRGEKGTLYEGGIRVPLIVRWPGMVKPGSLSEEPAISHDFYPTVVEAAGGTLPSTRIFDGKSLVPVLKSPDARLDRDALFFHYPHYHHSRPASAIRSGRWKLVEFLDEPYSTSVELYDLANDIGETKNLIDADPALAVQLLTRLSAWRSEVDAAMPGDNPGFDPKRRHEWWSRRSLKPIHVEKLRDRLDGKPYYPGAEKPGTSPVSRSE